METSEQVRPLVYPFMGASIFGSQLKKAFQKLTPAGQRNIKEIARAREKAMQEKAAAKKPVSKLPLLILVSGAAAVAFSVIAGGKKKVEKRR